MEIIQPRSGIIVDTYYQVEFYLIKDPGRGFAFDCDKDGNPENPKHKARIAELRQHPDYLYQGVVEHQHPYRRPAIGRCACGEAVALEAFTNTCPNCGRDYNMSGQELAPRSQWGEETGEHWTDCY
jgi:hypothetical protein